MTNDVLISSTQAATLKFNAPIRALFEEAQRLFVFHLGKDRSAPEIPDSLNVSYISSWIESAQKGGPPNYSTWRYYATFKSNRTGMAHANEVRLSQLLLLLIGRW